MFLGLLVQGERKTSAESRGGTIKWVRQNGQAETALRMRFSSRNGLCPDWLTTQRLAETGSRQMSRHRCCAVCKCRLWRQALSLDLEDSRHACGTASCSAIEDPGIRFRALIAHRAPTGPMAGELVRPWRRGLACLQTPAQPLGATGAILARIGASTPHALAGDTWQRRRHWPSKQRARPLRSSRNRDTHSANTCSGRARDASRCSTLGT
jgi:hypothetical protein